MLIKKSDLDKMERRYRANLINSITGVKPANLIGTRSNNGEDNLAIFSSVVHLGSHPAQIGMVTRPQEPKIKHTFSNIKATGYYTINQVSKHFTEKAHYTSANLERKDSEFDVMQLEREFIDEFHAPFVKESQIKIGMKLIDNLNLPNGCLFIIGEVVLIEISEDGIDPAGHLDLTHYDTIGISGLNSYYNLEKKATYPYAKHDQLPTFDA